MKYLPRVLHFVYPYWRLAVGSVLLILVGGVAGLATPWPMKLLVDHVLPNQPLPPFLRPMFGGYGQVTLLVFGVIASFLVTLTVQGINVLTQFVNTKLDQRMSLDFRTVLFEHAQKLSM